MILSRCYYLVSLFLVHSLYVKLIHKKFYIYCKNKKKTPIWDPILYCIKFYYHFSKFLKLVHPDLCNGIDFKQKKKYFLQNTFVRKENTNTGMIQICVNFAHYGHQIQKKT